MRATLNIPDALVKDIFAITGERNKTALISKALEEYARTLRRRKLLSLKGKGGIASDFDAQALRDRELGEHDSR